VTVLGAEAHHDLPRAAASVLREREATDVAAVIRQALSDEWQVRDEAAGAWRAARPDDIAILVPARTSLPFLEDALDAAGVPYRAEASSLVYQAAEVRALLACARAVADASDALSLVTALRSPLFGCGDDDLWRWKQAGGYFSIYSRLPAEDDALGDGPVGAALGYLRKLGFEARWMTPSEVLAAIIADRRMLEVAATGSRERDAWRRLRFVVDQARAWSEASHGGLRAYLAWAAHQGQEATRVAEAVLPETDTNAAKVMTVHAAKGLEFPIVVLSGMTSAPRGESGVRVLWPRDGGYAVKFGKGVETDDFEAAAPVDEQMDELEKRRLLYVAATRARDHLVVSLHRNGQKRSSTAAQLLADAGAVSPLAEPARPSAVRADAFAARVQTAPPPDWQAWLDELTSIRERARHVSAISASGLEGTEPEIVLESADEAVPAHPEASAEEAAPPGAAKGHRDVELPPWSKGRYGSAIGRAVHGVLQVIDLATGEGLDETMLAQCLAEGVIEQQDLVRALVESALGSEVVKGAAEREHWRETYVGTIRKDGTVLEGFVDLVYREDDGSLVIVDYKTEAIPAGAVESRVAYYRPQLDTYARAQEDAGAVRPRTKLLFLHPGSAGVAAG
jgi:ATP-dependent exoDNAse (exonuclease V) beta subunit